MSTMLRRIREIRGLNQRELAEAAGVNASSICRFETGSRTPSLPVALRIADKLRAPVELLFENLPDQFSRVRGGGR